MHRGSYPEIDSMGEYESNMGNSWLSAFNKVSRDKTTGVNTVSIPSHPEKPLISSVFGSVPSGLNTADGSTDLQKRVIMCNSHNILLLNREDVMNMSLSDAHETLFQLRVEGNLMKKGFRRLRLWKMRFFILSGKLLSYWEATNHNKMRHQAEITVDCTISLNAVSGRPFSFAVLPSKVDRLYIIDAQSLEERDMWIQCINVCKYLIQRINSRPALRGVGNVYDHFSLGQVLGHGRYGVVRLAECNDTLKKYAVKIINKKKVNREILKHELVVLRSIKQRCYQENLVTINEIYEDDFLIHIVMEYLSGGDLFERISKKQVFSEAEAARVIRHISRALQTLHSQNILHLDVKPENVIYVNNDPASDMKLADYGCCIVQDVMNKEIDEIVGTAGYVAPEVISKCEYSDKCDIYSLGVMLYILLVGYPPYHGGDTQELLINTMKNCITYNDDWNSISKEATDLVKTMLSLDPRDRPSIEVVLKNHWVNHPPSIRKSLLPTPSSQTLLQSLPSTLPGSRLYSGHCYSADSIASDEWLTPKKVESSDAEGMEAIESEGESGPAPGPAVGPAPVKSNLPKPYYLYEMPTTIEPTIVPKSIPALLHDQLS